VCLVALDEGVWLASRSGRSTSGSHCIVGWVSPSAGLDGVAKRRNPCPCREWNSGLPAHRLVTILTEIPRVQFLFSIHFNIILPYMPRSSFATKVFVCISHLCRIICPPPTTSYDDYRHTAMWHSGVEYLRIPSRTRWSLEVRSLSLSLSHTHTHRHTCTGRGNSSVC
jgi:hypothetical protein